MITGCDPTPAPREPFWHAVGLLCIPIVVGHGCHAVYKWIKREHKARIARRDKADESQGPR
jgi:hypothetical protein